MPFIMGNRFGLRDLFFIQQLIDLAKGAQLDSDHLPESVAAVHQGFQIASLLPFWIASPSPAGS